MFGEIAIIDGAPRSASVISLGNVKLGILFEKFVKGTINERFSFFTKSLLASYLQALLEVLIPKLLV